MASGSHATFGAYDSRVCCICGERLKITGDLSLRFYNTSKANLGWHVACEQPGWPHLKGDE